MNITHLVMFKFFAGASPVAAADTFTGSIVVTIPMLTIAASGTFESHSFSPLKRRVPVTQAFFRRRTCPDTDQVRRIADEHADELKSTQ